jgi:GNAT superfamily N-acetyltransferase
MVWQKPPDAGIFRLMIHELPPAEYIRIRPIVAGLADHLSIQAVIDGTVTGQIWVDNGPAPQTTFIRTPEGQYLAGTPTNLAFNQALADLLLAMPSVSLTYYPDTWESTLAALLPCKFAREYSRRYYTFRQFLLPNWRDLVPPGYEMAQVLPQFLARQDLVNLDEVRERTTEWTDFARDGFGFCLVHGNTIVSHCIADCVSGGACELGIATHNAYRRRGLGTLTLAATVEYCLDHHLTAIGWHCITNNYGSQRVAEKVGFGLAREDMQYANSPVAENPDDLAPAEWQAEAEFFEQAFSVLNRHSAYMAWRAALARAAAGEHGEALRLLHRAADSGALPPGWDAWLRESWELQTVRTDSGWPALLARAQAHHPTESEE